MPTVRAMRCRGIRPEALRKFMIDLGVGETDISISMDSIYAENRKLIDPEANRRFFVWDPVVLEIEGDVPTDGARAAASHSRSGLPGDSRWKQAVHLQERSGSL